MPTPSLSTTSLNTSSLGLFSSPEMTASSPLGIGDILGALMIGSAAYFLVVIPFLLGVFSLSGYFFKNSQNNGNDNLSGMNLIRFILAPILYLLAGLFVFAFVSSLLTIIFGINVNSWMKFFFEARYSALLGNIHASGQMQKVTEGALGFLDMASTAMFWSIPMIYFILYVMLGAYILAIFMENGNSEISIIKRIIVGLIVGFISVIIITIYTSAINRSIFRGGLNIANLGEVSSIENTNTMLVKREIKKILGGN